LLGAGFINCAIYSIMRFDVLAEKCLGHDFPSQLLVGFGVCSILLAAPFVLVQRNFRRLLAYSSIDHAGIMVAALGFGGKLGALGAVLHMLFHGVTKPLLFFSAGNVQQRYGSPYFRKVHGVMHTLPWTGGLFLLGAFAVTGTPPFSLFQSEFTALSAALAGDHSVAAALFVIGVVTIFVGFLVHMANLSLGAPVEGQGRPAECPWKLGAMLVVALTIGLFAFWLPGPVYNLVRIFGSHSWRWLMNILPSLESVVADLKERFGARINAISAPRPKRSLLSRSHRARGRLLCAAVQEMGGAIGQLVRR
jgi:hydrogenase-4 component F